VTKKLPTSYSLLHTPKFDPGLVVAGLLAIFAIVPLLAHPGLPNTADGPAHLMRQAELYQAWQDGVLYPRWAPDLAYGYGMPLFHYAPPLLYHLTQLFHLAGLGLDIAMKATIILMMFLYSLGMYLFARDLYGPRAGLLAAAVYLYAPYRLREAYVQGNYGQFCGLAFYPLILWSFHGLVTTHRRRYLPLAALSLAGLLLSHNISAMIFAPLFGAYLVFVLVVRGRESGNRGIGDSGNQDSGTQGLGDSGSQGIRDSGTQEIGESAQPPSPDSRIPDSLSPRSPDSPIPRISVAIALGLGLSAFFWLPAFGERDLIRLSGITTGFFDFRYNFISLAELLSPPRPLDLSAMNPYFPLSLGLAQLVFAALALLAIALHYVSRITPHASRLTPHASRLTPHASRFTFHVSRFTPHALYHTLFFATALLITVFLALPYSRPIWETVPLLELAEFPWRWLGPAILCAAVLAGAVWYMVERVVARGWLLVALGAGLLFVVAVNLFYLFPSQFIPWGTPTPADALAYEAESGAIGTTSAGEFLPRWADRFPRPDTLGPDYAAGRPPSKIDPASLPKGASAATVVYTARETRVAVDSPTSFAATFRALYWPGWRVLVSPGGEDGEYQIDDVEITRPDGLIRARLPAGEYQVSLRLYPTPIRRAATIVSVLAVVVFVGLVLVQVVGWLDGWLVGWLDGWLVGWVDGWLGGWVVGWLGGGEGAPSRDHESTNLLISQSPNLPISQFTNLPISQAVVVGIMLIVGLLVTRPMADWFRLQSPPGVVYGAQYEYQADFGEQVRLLAFDLDGWMVGWLDGWMVGWLGDLPTFQSSSLPGIQPRAGDSLPVVLYWRALAPLTANYSVFVHLDAPDGTTYASADELNPADIPTSRWPPSLYVRNPLTLALPPDLPPMRYTLVAGLYDPEGGARLLVTGCDGCPVPVGGDALPLAYVWVSSPAGVDERDIPNRVNLGLGDRITLLGYELIESDPARLTLYWRAEAPVEDDYTVFIHALDADGEIITQFDAPPLDGLYPTHAWLPGQIIADSRSLVLPGTARALSVGLYEPDSSRRLPVTGEGGSRAPDDAIRIQVAGGR
jgi:hypothetical protein